MTTQKQIDSAVNENGGGYSQAIVDADRACIASLQAKQAAFAAEWTPEVLAARKAAWNAEMQALIAAKKPMTPRLMTSIIAKLGYSLADINRAKALYA